MDNINLSEHFTLHELGLEDGTIKQVANGQWLCKYILEPIRQYYQKPVIITDGLRIRNHNFLVGGVHDSYHLYNLGHCAADFEVVGVTREEVYKYLKRGIDSKGSGLPFDKVIYELKDGNPHCLHIQADADKGPRRQAFIGHIALTGKVEDNKYIQEFDVI